MTDTRVHLHNPDREIWCRMLPLPDLATTVKLSEVTCEACTAAYTRRRDLCRWCGRDAFFDGAQGWRNHGDHYICPDCMRRRLETDTNGYPYIPCCAPPNFIEIREGDRIRTYTGRIAVVVGDIASHSARIRWDDRRGMQNGTIQRLGRNRIKEITHKGDSW